jgi:hypothetical protein
MDLRDKEDDAPQEQMVAVSVDWLQLPKDLWKCILELQTLDHPHAAAVIWRQTCKAWNNIFKELENRYVERRQKEGLACTFELVPLLGPTNAKLINIKVNLGKRECGRKIFFRVWLMWTYFSFDPREQLLPHYAMPLLEEHEPKRFELFRTGGSRYEATSDASLLAYDHSLLIQKILANFVEIKIQVLESSPFMSLFAHKRRVNKSGIFTIRLNHHDLLDSVKKSLFFRMLFHHQNIQANKSNYDPLDVLSDVKRQKSVLF